MTNHRLTFSVFSLLLWLGSVCSSSVNPIKTTTCEYSTLNLDCGSSTIHIVDATYGRTTSGTTCFNQGPDLTTCRASNSLNLVREACEGKSTCSVTANNDLFGDPCVNTGKYLEVDHVCEVDVMFPYGDEVGDTYIPSNDDGSSGEISINEVFSFYDNNYRSLFVNTNGVISFVEAKSDYTPLAFPLDQFRLLTPFWADVDTTKGGRIGYRELLNSDENSAIFDRANDIMKAAFIDQQNVELTWIFIATWIEVSYYGSTNTAPVNTFQCVLVSDGTFSAAIFNYDKVMWTTGTASGGDANTGLGGTPAQVGFNAGDGKHYYATPESRTPDVFNVTHSSNIEVPGRFVFRVDKAQVVDVACHDEGEAHLYPNTGTMFGGTLLLVSGPCFDSASNNVTCRFNDVTTQGAVQSPLHASCVVPQLFSDGNVNVQVSLDGGQTYPFSSGFQLRMPIYADNHVFIVEEGDWLTADSLSITWDTDVMNDVELVDIELYTYYEDFKYMTVHWEKIQTLATDQLYAAGTATFQKPDVGTPDGVRDIMGAIAVVEKNPSTLSPKTIWSDLDSLQYIYALSSVGWCQDWARAENTLLDFLQDRPACPCNLRQAVQDFAGYMTHPICNMDEWGEDADNCRSRPGAYHCVVATKVSVHGAGQECCYFQNGTLIEDRFADNGFGYAHRFHYKGSDPIGTATKVPFFSHFFFDVIANLQCCKFPFMDGVTSVADAKATCDLYKAVRPSQSCATYGIPKPASVFGAVHFFTFDGLNYTFNGQGEYTLVDANGFILQGRLEQFHVNISASILTALAVRQNSSTILSVQTSPRRIIDVYISHGNGTFELLDITQTRLWFLTGVYVTFANNISADGVQIVFDGGIGLQVRATGHSLRFILTLPSDYRGKTEGLLGVWNGDSEDDLSTSDGTTLPLPASMETIHDTFGPSYQVDSDDSLFFYLSGYDTEVYANSTFQPPLTAPTGDSLSVCRMNDICAFDYLTTGDADLAQATLDALEEFGLAWTDLKGGDSECPHLTPPANGLILATSAYRIGDQMLFRCDECYDVVGDSALTCGTSLTWSGQPPRCRKQPLPTCTEPEAPENGTVEMRECNRVAMFKCLNGSALFGVGQITCSEGVWSNDSPVCSWDDFTSEEIVAGGHSYWWVFLILAILVIVLIIVIVVLVRRNKGKGSAA